MAEVDPARIGATARNYLRPKLPEQQDLLDRLAPGGQVVDQDFMAEKNVLARSCLSFPNSGRKGMGGIVPCDEGQRLAKRARIAHDTAQGTVNARTALPKGQPHAEIRNIQPRRRKLQYRKPLAVGHRAIRSAVLRLKAYAAEQFSSIATKIAHELRETTKQACMNAPEIGTPVRYS